MTPGLVSWRFEDLHAGQAKTLGPLIDFVGGEGQLYGSTGSRMVVGPVGTAEGNED